MRQTTAIDQTAGLFDLTMHRGLDIVRKTLGQNEIATYHDDFPKLDHRTAPSFWAERIG